MDSPIAAVALRTPRGKCVIDSVPAIGAALIYDWPEKARRRNPYRTALRAAVLALGGAIEAETARACFVEAAQDAGLLARTRG